MCTVYWIATIYVKYAGTYVRRSLPERHRLDATNRARTIETIQMAMSIEERNLHASY